MRHTVVILALVSLAGGVLCKGAAPPWDAKNPSEPVKLTCEDPEHEERPTNTKRRWLEVLKHYYDPDKKVNGDPDEDDDPSIGKTSATEEPNIFDRVIKHPWPLPTGTSEATIICPDVVFKSRLLVGLVARPSDVTPQEIEVLEQGFIDTYQSIECGERTILSVTILRASANTTSRRSLQKSTNYVDTTYDYEVEIRCKRCGPNPTLTADTGRRILKNPHALPNKQSTPHHYLREELRRNTEEDLCSDACPAPSVAELVTAYNKTVTDFKATGELQNVAAVTDNFAELQEVYCSSEVNEFEKVISVTFEGDPITNTAPSDEELRVLESAFVDSYNSANALNTKICDLNFTVALEAELTHEDSGVGRERMLQTGQYSYRKKARFSCHGSRCQENPDIVHEKSPRSLLATTSELPIPAFMHSADRHLQMGIDECFCPANDPEERLPTNDELTSTYNSLIQFLRGEGKITSVIGVTEVDATEDEFSTTQAPFTTPTKEAMEPTFTCTLDVFECPSGIFVSRDPASNCKFPDCVPPTPLPPTNVLPKKSSDEPSHEPTEPSASPLPTKEAILLYENDFESPKQDVTIYPGCNALDNTPVNDLYGSPQGNFSQTNTVETIVIDANYDSTTPYVDPEGRGGNYAIGMLSTNQDDLLGLGFETSGKNFVNIAMDISSIEVFCCGFGGSCGDIASPIFNVSLIDDPNGSVPLTGTVLDSANVLGGPNGPNPWTYRWTRGSISLDASGSTNGRVSVVWDLLRPGYGVLDNIVVEASDFSL